MSPGLKFVKLTHSDFLKCENCMFNILKKREYSTDWRKYRHTHNIFFKNGHVLGSSQFIFLHFVYACVEYGFVTMMLFTNSSQTILSIVNDHRL